MGSTSNKHSKLKTKLKTIKVLTENKLGVYSLLLLSDHRLASCSYDNSIKIYDIDNNYNCDISIDTGDSEAISSICEINKNKIASGFKNQTIQIWKITKSTYSRDYIIPNAHNYAIWQIISLTNNRMASCSVDRTIKIWSTNHPYDLIWILEGKSNYVQSLLQIKEKEILVSTSCDHIMCLWNLSVYQCITVIKNIECCSRNNIFEIGNDKIIISGKVMLTVFNINKCKIEKRKVIDTFNYPYSLIAITSGNILFGSNEGDIGVYDINKNSFTRLFKKLHNNCIEDIKKINDNQFASCSIDNRIKIWEYS